MDKLIRSSESQSYCQDLQHHQVRVQPLASERDQYYFQYAVKLIRIREIQEQMEDLMTEHKRVKVRMRELEEICYPMRAAVAQITRKPSPQFSPDVQRPAGTSKQRKRSHQHSAYLN